MVTLFVIMEKCLKSMKSNKYRNKKSGEIYIVLGEVIDCTNERDGTICILYNDGKKLFVREKKEFLEKFEKVESNERGKI